MKQFHLRKITRKNAIVKIYLQGEGDRLIWYKRNLHFYLLFSYDCDDREAEDDELNGNDEDEESDAPENEEGKFYQ